MKKIVVFKNISLKASTVEFINYTILFVLKLPKNIMNKLKFRRLLKN